MDRIRRIVFYCAWMTLMIISPTTNAKNTATAIFAAGCFWCAEHDFQKIPGVIDVVSGYTGGSEANPSYEAVSSGITGHFESIKVTYQPDKISYQQLLDVFWHNVDPTDAEGQFCDKGKQYRSVIFYGNEKEKIVADSSKHALIASGRLKTIATLILPASTFYPAEEYHQHYSEKNPLRYQFYRYQCGRDKRLKAVWGK